MDSCKGKGDTEGIRGYALGVEVAGVRISVGFGVGEGVGVEFIVTVSVGWVMELGLELMLGLGLRVWGKHHSFRQPQTET